MKIKSSILFLLSLFLMSTSCSKEEKENNKDIEVVDIEEISYDEFLQQCAKNPKFDLSDEQTAEDFKTLQNEVNRRVNLVKQEMAATGTTQSDAGLLGICKITVKYKSLLPDGKTPVMMSGAIFMDRWNYWRHNEQDGFIIANHYTIGAEREAPSECFPYECVLCARNYIVVMADYLGFGPTIGMPQTYLHAQSTAQSVVDLALLARKVMADYKFTRIGNKVYNIGYSQGGHTTMAVHKLIQEKYSDKIKLTKTVAGGGPYDIPAVYNEFVTSNETGIPAAIPLIVLGMNYSENLGLDLSKIFLEPMLSNTDWVISKDYDIDQICEKMGGYDVKVDQILHPDALNLNNAQTKKLMTAFKKNSLNQGWTPTSEVPIHLFHSTKDDVVPVVCTENMINFIKQKTGKEPAVEKADYGSHMKAGISFLVRVVLEQIPIGE